MASTKEIADQLVSSAIKRGLIVVTGIGFREELEQALLSAQPSLTGAIKEIERLRDEFEANAHYCKSLSEATVWSIKTKTANAILTALQSLHPEEKK